MAHDKLMDRARDELFSHINRCGVLQASPEDQKTWMTETIDYIAERYPDLGDQHLDELQGMGIRFCQPAIRHGDATSAPSEDATEAAEVVEAEAPETADATAA